MSAIAAPADRRFRRAHVKPSRRHRHWRPQLVPALKYVALGLLVVFGVYRIAVVATHAHILHVDRILVRGNQRLSKGEVLAVLSGLQGESLVSADLDHWRKRLMASPWVRDAVLRRSLPSTVEVVIWEREPVSVARINGEMYLVDDRGVIIDQYGPQYEDLDLPIVDGLAAGPGEDGSLTDEVRADLAGRVIAAVRSKPALAKRLSQIDVTDAHNATVILTGDPALIQLGDEQFLKRLQSYVELAPTLRERVPDIDYVDLRFGDRIYVRPAGKAPRAGAAPGAGK